MWLKTDSTVRVKRCQSHYPLCVYATSGFSAHLLALFGLFHLLAVVNHVPGNTGVQILVWVLLSVLWGIYLGEELLGHMIILCSTFWETAKLFSTATEPFIFPPAVHKGSSFSTRLPMFVSFFLLILAVLAGVNVLSFENVIFQRGNR